MISLMVDPASVDGTMDYIDRIKQRIFEKVREGMREGMEYMAGEAVAAASAAGIQARTGQFFADIEKSPEVWEDPAYIHGQVDADSEMTSDGRKFQGYLGTALDAGFRVPATAKEGSKHSRHQGTSMVYQFLTSNGAMRFTTGHKKFTVRPHPFFLRAEEASQPTVLELIQMRIAEAAE